MAAIGAWLMGSGVVLNQRAGLGNDPTGIFYDGMRTMMKLSDQQLSIATWLVNIVLIGILLMKWKSFIRYGTVMYILLYGVAIQIAGSAYDLIPLPKGLAIQIAVSVIGCLFIYTGVALYVAAEVGYDPLTGMAMVISRTFKCSFAKGKMAFDGILLISGWLMGGKLGVITVITAVSAGPCIEKLAGKFAKQKWLMQNEK